MPEIYIPNRDEIAALVRAEVARQVAELSARPELPELLTPRQARQYTGFKDLRTIRSRYPDAVRMVDGRPMFLKSRIG